VWEAHGPRDGKTAKTGCAVHAAQKCDPRDRARRRRASDGKVSSTAPPFSVNGRSHAERESRRAAPGRFPTGREMCVWEDLLRILACEEETCPIRVLVKSVNPAPQLQLPRLEFASVKFSNWIGRVFISLQCGTGTKHRTACPSLSTSCRCLDASPL
jgi:hypothetical protein